MEQSVYVCGWGQSPKGISLWTKTGPRAVLEFYPPLPKSQEEAKYAFPELYLVCGDDRFETTAPPAVAFETAKQRETRFAWLDEFFERPVCRKCAAPTSPRSEKPLHLSYAPRQDDGAFGNIGHDGSTNIEIYSEQFLALLSFEERQHLIFRPVVRSRRSRAFYELVGPPGPPFVAVKGLPISGWQCSACNRSTWGYWIEGVSFHSFVADCDLPRLSGIFTVGTPPEVYLCVTGARWRDLLDEKKGARGFVSHPLGVVSDRDIVRNPKLPTFEERLAAGSSKS